MVNYAALATVGAGAVFAAMGAEELAVGVLANNARTQFETHFPSLAATQDIHSQNNEWDAFRHAFAAANQRGQSNLSQSKGSAIKGVRVI